MPFSINFFNTPGFSLPLFERMAKTALPFLQFHQSTNRVVTGLLLLDKSWKIVTGTVSFFQSKEKKKGDLDRQANFSDLVILSSVALSILHPSLGFALVHGIKMVTDVHRLAMDLWNWEFGEALKEVLSITQTVVYIASIAYASPEILLIALVAQATLDLWKASVDWEQDKKIECLGNVLLALLRLYLARYQMEKTYRDYYGNKLDGDTFLEILQEVNQTAQKTNRQTSFDSVLRRRFFSSHVSNIYLNNVEIKNIHFRGMRFDDCRISQSTVLDTTFRETRFFKVEVEDTLFRQVSMESSFLYRLLFSTSKFENVHWISCLVLRTDFFYCTLTDNHFSFCKLPETTFFQSKVSRSSLEKCDLTDCLLLTTVKDFHVKTCTKNQFTRPVIGLLWDYKAPGPYSSKIKNVLEKEPRAIVLKIHYLPNEIEPDLLKKEVQDELPHISTKGSLSVLQALVNRGKSGSQIEKIVQNAQNILSTMHALVLPGGEDIPSEIYEMREDSNNFSSSDYRRVITEGVFLDLALKLKMPVMGICRGAQLGYVFRGGKLLQYVNGHFDKQQLLTLSKSACARVATIVREVIGGESLFALSMHLQAADQNHMAQGLHVIIEHQGIPKLLASEDGLEMYLQFHPEAHDIFPDSETSNSNRNFFRYLLKKAEEYRLTSARTAA